MSSKPLQEYQGQYNYWTNGEVTLERSQREDFMWNLYCERSRGIIDKDPSRTAILQRNKLTIKGN